MTFSILTSSPCASGEVYFDLLLLTDGKGYEISWTLSETITGNVLLTGSGYSSYEQNSKVQCIPANCYTFTIIDAGGDGLCCNAGYGGYSVRLNGLKLASGNEFGAQDEVDLTCLLTPTMSPTVEVSYSYTLHQSITKLSVFSRWFVTWPQPTFSPSKSPTLSPTVSQMPTEIPSETPSMNPSSSPTDPPRLFPIRENCSGDEVFIEVITEGDEFINDVSWIVQDVHGSIVIENNATASGGLHAVYACISRNECYTFTIHDSVGSSPINNDGHRGLFTINLDDNVAFSGSNFHTDHHIMFGECRYDACLSGGPNQNALFRLELVGDTAAANISWKLLNSNNVTVREAGPFGDCDINTLAACIPNDCYKFVATNKAGESSEKVGLFTVLFTEPNGTVQKYTRDFSMETLRVFLGSC
jgi:hypothetical protein